MKMGYFIKKAKERSSQSEVKHGRTIFTKGKDDGKHLINDKGIIFLILDDQIHRRSNHSTS